MSKNGLAKTPSKSMFYDAMGIAAVKTIEERLLAATPVGNGTIGSGIVKGILGFATGKLGKGSKLTNIAATAFVVDCAEDIVNGVIGMLKGANSSSTDVWA